MEKKYLNNMHNLEAEASGLLGFFDTDNSYILEENIIKELIECNKQIVSYDKEKIEAKAQLLDFSLNFCIYLQDGEGNVKRAGLFLVEKATLGIVEEPLQTYVDSFVAPNTPMFFEEVKKKYHLYGIDESEGIDIRNSKCVKIIEKKGALTKKYNSFLPLMVNVEKEYVKKILKEIQRSGEQGSLVLENIKKVIEDRKINKLNPNYWRKVRVEVDKLVQKSIQVLPPVTIKNIKDLQVDFLNKIKDIKIIEQTSAKSTKKKGKDDKPKKFEPKEAPKINYMNVGAPTKEIKGEFLKVTGRHTEIDDKGNIKIEEISYEMFGTDLNADKQKGLFKRRQKQNKKQYNNEQERSI